jgi:hypothetical protein
VLPSPDNKQLSDDRARASGLSTKTVSAFLFGAGIVLAGWQAAPVAAQETPPDPLNAGTAANRDEAAVATSAEPGLVKPAVIPRVLEASSNDEDPQRIGLGYVVVVEVENLPAFLESTGTRCDNLTLFINDVPIKGLAPDSCDLADGRARFTLVRDEESAQAWRQLFTEPWEFTNKVSLSLGPHERLSWPSQVDGLELVILPRFWVNAYFVGLALAIALAVWLSARTALLRGRGDGMADGDRGPYSLARFQLAFWAFLVIAAYVFIWMITGELDTITGSVLALLGIGSGTALGAAMIDQGKDDKVKEEAAETAAAATEATPAAALAAATAALAAKPVRPVTSRGFLKDVLSDEGGVSIHRLQLFVWTLVLGIIFCTVVYGSLEMPQFSSTLLGLMGISSGTYLGLKVPEDKTGKKD